MTEDDALAIMAKPENVNRVGVFVRMDGDEFVAEWEGVEYRAGNPFGLDSELTYAGVPQRRNLFLIGEDA